MKGYKNSVYIFIKNNNLSFLIIFSQSGMIKKRKTKSSIPSSLIVTQANELVEARYSLPLSEQRLVLTMLSRVQPNDEDFKEYRISINEFAEFMGIDKNHVYVECKKTTKQMLTRVLEIQKPTGLLQINWVSSAEYVDGEGCVKLCFDPKLKPFLLQLKSNFTSCKLEMLLSFKSQYTIRIYTLLKQYEKLKEREIELEELRQTLGIAKNQYQDYKNIKTRILQATQKELKEKADLYFEFDEIKYGRRVGAIRFRIFTRDLPKTLLCDQTSLLEETTSARPSTASANLNATESSVIDELLFLVSEPHQNKKTVKSALIEFEKKQGRDYVKRNILYSNEKAGKSYAGFLANALKNDWGHDWHLEQEQTTQKPARKKVQEIWERQGFKSQKEYDDFMYQKQMQNYGKKSRQTG